MAIVGTADTLTLDQTQRVIDMKKGLLRFQPDATPITTLTSRLGAESTHNPKFQWSEKNLPTYADAVNNGAGYSDSATSIVVDTGTVFSADELVKVPRTGEVFRVTARSTNTLTVVRGVGGGAAALVDNDVLIRLSSAMSEGAEHPTPRAENPTTLYNYTGIFRKSYSLTETALRTRYLNSEDPWEDIAHDKAIEQKRDVELAFLFGKPSEATHSNGYPVRTTGGVTHFVQTNVTDASGALAETTELNPLIRTVFRYASKSALLAVASDLVLDVINSYGVGKLQTIQSDDDKTYGLQIMSYQTPNGKINFVSHRLLSENSTYNGYAMLLDFECLRRRYLEGRDMQIKTNRQANSADLRVDELLCETGLEFGEEKRHGLLVGVTG